MSRSVPGSGVVRRTALACLFSGLCVVATAQTQPSLPAGPAAPAAKASLVYQSAFASYKRHDETATVSSWRKANDEVGRIGGWRAYAKEARQPEPTRTPSAPAGAGKP